MNVLLTGANGLLGHNIILCLLEHGHSVHAIVRRATSLCIQDPNLHVFEGNFMNYNDLRNAAVGCAAAIHAAATTDMSQLYYSCFEEVIVEGSETVIKVCNNLNIKTIVYISTANTIGYGNPDKPADEHSPMQSPFTESFYAKAKKHAEELFVAHSQSAYNHVIIINPAFMLGAYDTKPSSGAMLLAAHRRHVALATKGGKNFVHAGDVAQAAVNALTMGNSGERYIAGCKNFSIKELYLLQKKVTGYPKYVITLPTVLVKLLGVLGNLLRVCGIAVVFSSVNLKQLCVQEYYTSQKAVEKLGMPQTPVEKAIADSLGWFARKGKIRPTKKMSLQ